VVARPPGRLGSASAMANAPVDLGELAEKGEDGVGSPCGRGIGEAVEIG
jgi:hypothetical protein